LINPEQDLKRQGGGAENLSGGKQIDLYRMFLTIHILKMDIDLDFLLELKRGELERLGVSKWNLFPISFTYIVMGFSVMLS